MPDELDEKENNSLSDVKDEDQFLLVIECKNETDQNIIYEELLARNYNIRLMD